MVNRLKILMVTRLFPSEANPTLGTFCAERARALAKQADVRIMVPVPYYPDCLPGPGQWKSWCRVPAAADFDGGIRVTYPRYFSMPKIGTFTQGPALAHSVWQNYRREYRNWVPDVIDAHFAFPDGYGAYRLASKLNRPLVVTCHGGDLRVYPNLPFVKRMIGKTFRYARRVISVSSFLKANSVALGCAEEKNRFLSNGVDPARFELRPKQACRTLLGLPIERKIGVYVGHLIDRKNQSLVLQALAEIGRQGQEKPFVVFVGDGPNRQSLQREIRALNLEGDALLVGRQPHGLIGLWMGAGDYVLLSSRYEGWATVYFEAMACGRPIVTANVQSAKDAVCRPEYGIVVEPYTAGAFAGAMLAAGQTQYDEHLLRANAEWHSWDKWAEAALREFSGAVAEHGRATPAALQDAMPGG